MRTDAAFRCWRNKSKDAARVSRREVTFSSEMKKKMAICKNLFVPHPPELRRYHVWLITLITLSLFVGECCGGAEMRLIHYQRQVHPSVNGQMLFIHRPALILLSDVFKSPRCKSLGGKSEDKTLTAGLRAAHIILELISVNNIRNGACGRIQTGLTFLV